MQPEDMILISLDDHVVEPPDLFEGRLPAAYADRAPKVVRTDDGSDGRAGGAAVSRSGASALS